MVTLVAQAVRSRCTSRDIKSYADLRMWFPQDIRTGHQIFGAIIVGGIAYVVLGPVGHFSMPPHGNDIFPKLHIKSQQFHSWYNFIATGQVQVFKT